MTTLCDWQVEQDSALETVERNADDVFKERANRKNEHFRGRAGQGPAWLGEARPGTARQGKARQLRDTRAVNSVTTL